MILAVDPSIVSAGMALFDDDRHCPDGLVFAARVTADTDDMDPADREFYMASKILATVPHDLRHVEITALVGERPQIYQRGGRRTKGDPNDQLFMVGVVAALRAMLPRARVKTYHPSDWKGQMKKAVVLRRIMSALTDRESALVPSSHDAGEAVGIGLRFLGRLEPARVFPGAT